VSPIKLTPAECALILHQRRRGAIDACRALGCTCHPEPDLTLTEEAIGRGGLPAWMSTHREGCQIAPAGPQAGARAASGPAV
jgi:hypothetical protein